MKIDAVIFDLDGVIVSTDDCHYKAWKKMADEEGIYFDKSINNRLRGVSRMASLEIILERSSKSYSEPEKQQLAERKNNYYKSLIRTLTPDDILCGATELTKKLRTNGIKLAIGSSSKNTPIILEQIGLNDYFDAISDGNNIVNSKPNPEVFLKAADMLCTAPSHCLVVEDADAGIVAAKAGGMYAAAVGAAKGNPKADISSDSVADLYDLIAEFADL